MAIRITQAGMALTVGIIIVTGLIIGGFFIVKNSGEQARRDEAIKIAEQNREQEAGSDVALNANDPAENNGSVNEDTPADTSNSEASEDSSAAKQAEERAAEQAASELPQTGPADHVSNMVVFSVLAFSVASYVSSRRQA